jgi:hypothetical protein
MAKDEATDGSTRQWDKLKAMRGKRDGDAAPAGGPAAASRDTGVVTDPKVVEEAKRLRDGGTAGGTEDETDETPPAQPDADATTDDDADDDEQEPEKVVVQAHERAKPAPKQSEEKAPPGTEAVEIDGKKVFVPPELAAALRDSEETAKTAAKSSERDELVDAVVGKVRELLPKQPDPAAAAAAKALEDAMREEAPKHPMPDAKLAISDPDEYNKQLQSHIAEKSERAATKAIAERDVREQQQRQTNQTEEAKRQEAWAREQLGIQFYRQFKVLDDPDVKDIVDVLLNKKFDEVIASGVLGKPGTPAEREALKVRAFNDVAAAATKKIVKLRGGTTPQQAPAPPPNLNTSATGRGPRAKPIPPPAKSKEKYPAGTVSSMLKAHQDKKAGRSSAT